MCGRRIGEGLVEGEVFGVERELIVGSGWCGGLAGSGCEADGQLAICDAEVIDGYVGGRGSGGGCGLLMGAAYAGVVPGSVGGAQEVDVRCVHAEAGDVDLVAEDEGD